MAAQVTGLERFWPRSRRILRIRMDDITEIDIDRTGTEALVADRAMIGHIVHFVEMPDGNTATGLFLVEKGLDDQTGGQNLVARRIQQVGTRYMGVAHRFAFAAAQTVADIVVEVTQLALFQQQRLLLHQAQRGRIGIVQPGTGQQLAGVEMVFRIDLLLVGSEGIDDRRIQVAGSW